MTHELIEKATQLARNPTSCNWFQFFAQETWDRIGFVRTRRGLRIWETTITQNLMFVFHTSKEAYWPIMRATWNIEILEAVNEATNGNDMELFVETTDGVIFFAVQAKIINHKGFKRAGLVDGNYPNMNHAVGGQNQIDLLINYANSKNGIPLYLLYNFVKDSFEEDKECEIKFGIEQYGCSIANANYIRDHYMVGGAWTVPTFKNLHPDPALPWFVIPCCMTSKSKKEALDMLSAKNVNAENIKAYSLEEVQNDRNWKPLSPFKDINKENDDEKVVTESGDDEPSNDSIEFKPRYRVIVSPKLSFNKEIKPF